MNALTGVASDLPPAGAGGPLRSTAADTVTGADAADPALDLPLAGGGTTFIEASAGTGKTRALTTLVARLVLEEGWPVDRILVVTFTRAATAELRDRIRQVLGTLLAAARVRMAEPRSSTDGEAVGPEIDPQAARDLLAAWERREGEVDFTRAVGRLRAAMHDIDRANVLTIHGFCQRVLADLAFESGFPFGCEVGGDGGETVAGEVRDFWRRRFYPASMLVVRHAFESGFLPGELAGWVSKRRAKVGAELVGVAPPAAPMETCEAAWRAVFDATRSEWERHRSGFRTEILEGPWLNRQRYRKARSERDLAAFEALFAASEPRLPDADVVGRYGRQQLSQACRKGCTAPANPLFDAFDRLAEASREFRAACDGWLRWTRREALVDVRRSVRRRIRADRRLAYDDLLIELDDALGSAGGQRLAERIRHEFPCALIDEYQDTDPVQARIFTLIYGGARTGSTGPGGARRGESGGAAGSDTDREAAVAGTPGSAQPGRDASSRAETPEPGRPVEDEGSGTSTRGERTRPGSFIVVGDPKQSIYRFRGADVFAYLAARRTARERPRLGRNWRSVPALVEAVNAVFAGTTPFVVPEIEYRPVAPAMGGDSPLRAQCGESAGPLEFWLLPGTRESRFLTKKEATPVVAGATANEIARFLTLGARGAATIEGRALTGADIAVLVRTREQGRLIAGALRERGVRSIEIDDGSVFHTREAEQLERLLWCVAEPGRESRVRGALAGDLFGLDARALLALGDDERTWSAWTDRLADWRAHRESRGIGALLLRLLEGEGGARQLLRHRDGARRLTNYRHLAELLLAAETRERLSPIELAAWLNHRRTDTAARDDELKLRIESDEQLVRILTVHGSKGLEFPVVFCPFAWDGRSPERRGKSPERRGKAKTGRRKVVDAVYHRGAMDGYREVVDLHPGEAGQDAEWLEEFSESVRLLYVALTRAKYRCVVAWGQVHGAEHAPLAWLLHRPADENTVAAADQEAPDVDPGPAQGDAAVAGDENGVGAAGVDTVVPSLRAVADRFAGLDAPTWLAEIDAFARRHPNAVSTVELDPEPPSAHMPAHHEEPPAALAARQPRRPLRRIRSLTSFTALSAEVRPEGGAFGGSPADRGEAEVDQPDHDQHEEPADAAASDPVVAPAMAGERTAFTFPRGPVAGSCLHRIFESLDTAPATEADGLDPNPDLNRICRDALDDFGIDDAWRPVARTMVERTRSVLLREPGPERGDADRGADGHADSGRGTDSGDAPGSGEETAEDKGAGSDITAGSGGVASGSRPISGVAKRSSPGAGSGSEGMDAGSGSDGTGAGADPDGTDAGSGSDGTGAGLGSDGTGTGAGPDGTGNAVTADGRGDAATTEGFRLDDSHRRLVELEFHFPVEGFDRDRLAARMVEHGYPDPFARSGRIGTCESPPLIHGFLRGYIDLVTEHAGRWYILDYKSNWLGPGPGDYGPEALAAAMRAGGYTLQSLIYLVALHRYLSVRLPGYEYERHVGGAFYLFVRGIDPAAGMDRGVHFDRPTAECLLALDDCFRGGGA